jgi:hypothetical protein
VLQIPERYGPTDFGADMVAHECDMEAESVSGGIDGEIMEFAEGEIRLKVEVQPNFSLETSLNSNQT